MKFVFVSILMIGILHTSCAQSKKLRKEFNYHFRMLDSAAKSNEKDTVYCCVGSIGFFEKATSIKATGFINFFGALGYTKGDLKKWHDWYDKKYKKE